MIRNDTVMICIGHIPMIIYRYEIGHSFPAWNQARILALNEQGIAPKLFIVGRKGVQALTTRMQPDNHGMGMEIRPWKVR